MESYIVSARKYRPVTFSSVVGQEAITQTLKNAVKSGHLAQAFLFCGPRGVGKTTCARILAKTINCQNLTPDFEACDECESCKAFNQSASFNIIELDAASNNSVEDIRHLVDQVRIPPQIGKYKVYIIDEVHMLSQAAFNAFLKTLEEPPAYAKFILATTEKNKIIPTILSRCQVFDFKRITIEDIVNHLQFVAKSENITAEPEALHVIAQKSDGAMRDALSLFDQMVSFSGTNLTYKNVIDNLNILDYDYFFKMVNYMLEGNSTDILLTINTIFDNGFEGQHFIVGMCKHLRSLLISKNPATLKLLQESESLKKRYEEQAAQCSQQFLLNALNIFNKCDIDYRQSNNKHLLVEIALLNVAALYEHEQKKKSDVAQSTPLQTQQNNTSSVSQAPKTTNPTRATKQLFQESASQTTSAASQVQKPSTLTESVTPQTAVTGEQPAAQKIAEPQRTASHVTRTSPSLIRISDIGKKKQDETVVNKDIQQRHNEFTVEEVKYEIDRYAESINKDNTFLANLLEIAIIKIRDNDVIEFHFANKVNGDTFNKDSSNIVRMLRGKLANDNISVTTVIDETISNSKPYTDTEKFAEMMENNHELKYLKNKLMLEAEF